MAFYEIYIVYKLRVVIILLRGVYMFFRVGDIIINGFDTNNNNSCYYEYFTETKEKSLLKVNIERDIFKI